MSTRSNATSNTSDSDTAPLDFHIGYTKDSLDKTSDICELCQLCNNLRRSFYCTTCIRTGVFVHSNPIRIHERFSDKNLKLLETQRERDAVKEHCLTYCAVARNKDIMKNRISECQRKLMLLKAIKKNLLESSERQKRFVKQEEQDIERIKRQNQTCIDKLKKTASMKEARRGPYKANMSNLYKERQNAMRLRQKRVCQLTKHIFPITEFMYKPNYSSATERSLAGATQDTFVDGKWVQTWTENKQLTEVTEPGKYMFNADVQHIYRIVAPTLPANGNYSKYNEWAHIGANGSDASTGTSTEFGTTKRNPFYSIGAGLAFTAQMVHILAYFLDITLPRKLHYSKFYMGDLRDESFAQAVAKLNANILHICMQQGLTSTNIAPRYTLENMRNLVRDTNFVVRSKYGLNCPLEWDRELIRGIEELESSVKGGVAEDTESSDSENESDHLTDFELVQPTPCWDESSPNVAPHPSSVASGIMSSAAASVASFFSGLTGQR